MKKSSSSQSSSSLLPSDLLIHIFEYIDTRSLLNSSLVCQSWYSSSNHDTLWRSKFKHIQCLPSIPSISTNIKKERVKYLKQRDAKIRAPHSAWYASCVELNRCCFISSPFALILCISFLAVWFGLFFGVNFREVQMKLYWHASTCTVISRDIRPYRCCDRECPGCNECSKNMRKCQDVLNTLPINQTEQCCNGHACCATCCDTCSSCDNNGCTSYTCNCGCCQDVNDDLCTVTCRQCWNPMVVMKYNTTENVTLTSSMEQDCSTNFGCVDSYFEIWQVGRNVTCWYNPEKPTEFTVTNEYTQWKLGVMGLFAALVVVTMIWILWILIVSLPACLILGKIRRESEKLKKENHSLLQQ